MNIDQIQPTANADNGVHSSVDHGAFLLSSFCGSTIPFCSSDNDTHISLQREVTKENSWDRVTAEKITYLTELSFILLFCTYVRCSYCLVSFCAFAMCICICSNHLQMQPL